MNETEAHASLIADLSADLKPVRRLRPPMLRAIAWLAGALLFAGILYLFPRHVPMGRGADPGGFVAVSIIGSIITAALAVYAAFQLSLPDRSALWALLPLPSLVVWLVAAGLGCMEGLFLGGLWGSTMIEAGECLISIVLLSLPLTALLVVMIRRAAPIRPNVTALLAGLAVAAAASSLLIFVHPHDSALLDLVAHLLAIGLVIGANVALGGRLLSPPANFSRAA